MFVKDAPQHTCLERTVSKQQALTLGLFCVFVVVSITQLGQQQVFANLTYSKGPMGETPPVERINMYWKTGIHNPVAKISAVHIRHKYSEAKEEPAEATNTEASRGKKKSTIEKNK